MRFEGVLLGGSRTDETQKPSLESESAQQIPNLTKTSGVPVATAEGAELLGVTADKFVVFYGRGTL